MLTLLNNYPACRVFYVTLLVVLWVGATITNVSTLFGTSQAFLGLAGISVFIGVEIVRSYKRETPRPARLSRTVRVTLTNRFSK